MIKGKLEAFFETGTEGVIWSIYMDGKEGYDALYSIKEGDYITIYNEEDKIIYQGDIIEDVFSNWYSYPMNPILGQQAAGCYLVHWVQANVDPDKWCEWFNKSLRAEITESKLNPNIIKNIKESIIQKYYITRKFSDVIIEKSKLKFDPKKPEHWGSEGASCVGSLLFSAQTKYQIFDDKYYTMILLENVNDFDHEIKIEDINKSLFTELNLLQNKDILKQIKEYKKFNEENLKKDFEKHLSIMFGQIKDEKYFETFNKLNEDYTKSQEYIGQSLLDQLNNVPTYKFETWIFKLVSFDEVTSDILKK